MEDINIVQVLLTLSLALIASFPGSLSLIRQAKKDSNDIKLQKEKNVLDKEKNEVDAVEIVKNSALSLIIPLKEKIKELEGELVKINEQLRLLEKMLNDKDARIQKLEKEIEYLTTKLANMVEENNRLNKLVEQFIKKG